MFALHLTNGDVSIDDVRFAALETKLFEDHLADLLLGTVYVVVALLFMVGRLVSDEVALKGSHRRLVKEGRVGTTPQIPHIVDGILMLGMLGGGPV